MSYAETMAIPFGRLLDLIAVEQIKTEEAKEKRTEEDDFFALLERK